MVGNEVAKERFRECLIEEMAAFTSTKYGHEAGAYRGLEEKSKKRYRIIAKEWMAAYGSALNKATQAEIDSGRRHVDS